MNLRDRFVRIGRRLVRLTGPMTGLGRAVAVVAVVSWLVAARWDWQELAVLAGMSLAALVVSVAFTFGRTRLRVHTELVPPRVVAGDMAVAQFTVTNIDTRRLLPVRLEVPVGVAFGRVDVPTLAAGGSFEETLVIPTERRAVISVGPTRSVRGDPLGLMRREVQWTDQQELFVHPRTSRLQGLSSGWLRDLEGQETNDRSQSDVAFHTLREYVPGDDRRHVHWRTSARLGKLMVRQFIDVRRSMLAVVLSTDPGDYADADEFELALSMGVSLGLRASIEGQEVLCFAGTREVPAHSGQALLDGISRVELGDPVAGMHQVIGHAQRHCASASVVAICVGGGVTLADAQVAAQRFGSGTSVLLIRAAKADGPTCRRNGSLAAVSAPSLDDFTRGMWTVFG